MYCSFDVGRKHPTAGWLAATMPFQRAPQKKYVEKSQQHLGWKETEKALLKQYIPFLKSWPKNLHQKKTLACACATRCASDVSHVSLLNCLFCGEAENCLWTDFWFVKNRCPPTTTAPAPATAIGSVSAVSAGGDAGSGSKRKTSAKEKLAELSEAVKDGHVPNTLILWMSLTITRTGTTTHLQNLVLPTSTKDGGCAAATWHCHPHRVGSCHLKKRISSNQCSKFKGSGERNYTSTNKQL